MVDDPGLDSTDRSLNSSAAVAGPNWLRARLLDGRVWFWVLAVALVAVRFRHMGEIIAGPHSGRQCDTAFYALDFYHNGINLLHPSMCYMGLHKTLAFEFPLPEAVMALGYHVFGPRHAVARALTLLAYLGSAWYFYLLVQYLRNGRAAKLATLLYLATPLALFYSRAMHIDFWTVLCSHAMLYYLLRGYDEERTGLIVLGTAFGILAFLIKAPYAFYLFFPFGLHALRRLKLKRLLAWAPIMVLPLVAFALWRWHVARVNAAAPDWFFIPDYMKFALRAEWFFGPLSQRLEIGNWLMLARRVVTAITGTVGIYLLLIGLIPWSREKRGLAFFWVWLAGVGLYVLIFFNLNLVHDYYQIPFLAPLAFFIAVALETLFLEPQRPGLLARAPLALTVLLLVGVSVRKAEASYYEVDWIRVSAGARIREHTPEDALVIASPSQPNTWWWDPRLLYRARRLGWNIRTDRLSEENIGRLVALGATHLAIVSDRPVPPYLVRLLETSPKQVLELKPPPWLLHLYRLDPTLRRETEAGPPPPASRP